MNMFHLQIVTPQGLILDKKIQKLLVRTTEGDVGILANHSDYVSPIGIGLLRVIKEDGTVHNAACSGGFLSVKDKITRVIANTFEWAEDIDIERAQRAKTLAEEKMAESSDYEEALLKIKLKKALLRMHVGSDLK